jgi:DNA-directed RNA polymerase specialized sigma24 family protein
MEGICAGLTLAEIAELLGKKPATVRKHLQLARYRLSDELRQWRSQSYPARSDLPTRKENR